MAETENGEPQMPANHSPACDCQACICWKENHGEPRGPAYCQVCQRTPANQTASRYQAWGSNAPPEPQQHSPACPCPKCKNKPLPKRKPPFSLPVSVEIEGDTVFYRVGKNRQRLQAIAKKFRAKMRKHWCPDGRGYSREKAAQSHRDIGDKTARRLLNVFQKLKAKYPKLPDKDIVEHSQICRARTRLKSSGLPPKK
jgi:hypothetical protein